MRRVGLLLVVIGLVAAGCGTVRAILGLTAPAVVDISGKWVGTWRGHDVLGTPRTEDATADFVQQGSRGTGRIGPPRPLRRAVQRADARSRVRRRPLRRP